MTTYRKQWLRQLIVCAAALLLAAALCACGGRKQEPAGTPAEPQEETTEPTQEETTEPEGEQPGTIPAPVIPSGTQGVLDDYMHFIDDGIRQMDGDGRKVQATWNEFSGTGALFNNVSYDTLAYVGFAGEDYQFFSHDGGDLNIVIVDVFAEQKDWEQVSRYLPLFVLRNNAALTPEQAETIVETCLDTASYSGDGMACYYYESEGQCHFLATCSHDAAQGSSSAPSPTAGAYTISRLPGTFSVPAGYHVYSKESGYTREMCDSQGIDYEGMGKYLDMGTVDAMIVPAEQMYQDAEVKINIRIKDEKDYHMDDLAAISTAELKLVAETLVTGFGQSDYEIVEGNGLRYIVFSTKIVSDEIRYATIINGKMVYVYAQFSGELSPQRAEDLRQIALSIVRN